VASHVSPLQTSMSHLQNALPTELWSPKMLGAGQFWGLISCMWNGWRNEYTVLHIFITYPNHTPISSPRSYSVTWNLTAWPVPSFLFPDTEPWWLNLILSDTYQHLLVHPDDWELLSSTPPVCVNGELTTGYFVNLFLSFGARSAPAQFLHYADAPQLPYGRPRGGTYLRLYGWFLHLQLSYFFMCLLSGHNDSRLPWPCFHP